MANNQDDPEILAYNPGRMLQLLAIVTKNQKDLDIKEDLLSLTKFHLQRKYDEKYLREYLIFKLLWGGNGSRPTAIARFVKISQN